MRETLAAMTLEDRMIVRLRFVKGMKIADVARIMDLPQRPLYRRIEAILDRFRQAIRAAAIDPRDVEALIGTPENAMDFGLWKNMDAIPATEWKTAPDAAGERL